MRKRRNAHPGVKTEVLVEGVRVLVRLDERGRPITATGPACWGRGGDAERISKLACGEALFRLHQERKQAHDANRTARSAEERSKRKRAHSSKEWLQAAYNRYPDCGAERLTYEARKIAKLNGVDEAKRDKITEYRAKGFLKAARGK